MRKYETPGDGIQESSQRIFQGRKYKVIKERRLKETYRRMENRDGLRRQ